jgi:nitroimidazol reductase NimA-like FMN-containing flavoprotein (pyridoxamine 5'-phosphate oxidase superfamily)
MRSKSRSSRWFDAIPVRATGVDARGPGLRGPTAMGAAAVGATAVGAVAIGRLAVGHASIKRLVIDDLEIKRMRVAGERPEEPDARARWLLDTQGVMTIATADEAGRPSVAPVSFAHDDAYDLYWVSSKSAQHSENIRKRPEVSIVVFVDDPSDGVYVDARAEELADPAEIASATGLLNARERPSKFFVRDEGDVTGDAAWRIYKATRGETTVRDDATEQGQLVTTRTPVRI